MDNDKEYEMDGIWRQCNIYNRVENRSFTKIILSGQLNKLLRKRKYVGTSLGNIASLKATQQVLLKESH